MRLLNRITLPTAAIALLLLVLGVSGAWYVLRLQRLNSEILDNNVSSIRAAEEMEMLVREMRHELDRYLLTHDRAHLVQSLDKDEQIEPWLRRAQELVASEHEEAIVHEIQQGLHTFFDRLQRVVAASSDPVADETVDRLANDTLTHHVLVYTRKYLDLNEQELQNSNEQNKAMAERLAMALLLLGTCGAIAGLVAGYGIARGIRRSIFQLLVPIRDVAGKLNEFVAPIELSDPNIKELETILQKVSSKVANVVEELQERHREVIRADQLAAVGQLAAGLAHELRNPLMCIKTLVQSARRAGDAAHLDPRDLAVLDEELVRLENLLQAFLDFARPPQLEKRPFDLAEVVRQTASFLGGRASRRNVAIECNVPTEPLLIEADAAQLRQVLLNLLMNALDAVQKGGTIWVRAWCENGRPAALDTEHRVYVRIADNGCGLPKDSRHRICDPFFSTKETGLGLGLSISQRIIHAHGGELSAINREGGGAIFEVALPACVPKYESRSIR